MDSQASAPRYNLANRKSHVESSHQHKRRQESVNPFDVSGAAGDLGTSDDNAEAGPSKPHGGRQQAPNQPSLPADSDHPDDEDDHAGPSHPFEHQHPHPGLHGTYYPSSDPLSSDDENAEPGPSHHPQARDPSSNPFGISSDAEAFGDDDNEAVSRPVANKGKGRALDDDELPPSSPFRFSSPRLPEHDKDLGKENTAPHSENFAVPPSSVFDHVPRHSRRDEGQDNAEDSIDPPPPAASTAAMSEAHLSSRKRGREDFEEQQQNGETNDEQSDGVESNYDPNPEEEMQLQPPPKKARLQAADFDGHMNPRSGFAQKTNARTSLATQVGTSRQALPVRSSRRISFEGAISVQRHPLRHSSHPPWANPLEQHLLMHVDAVESRSVDGGNYSDSHDQSAEESKVEEELEREDLEKWRREKKMYNFRKRRVTEDRRATSGGIVLYERVGTPDFTMKQAEDYDVEFDKGPHVWMPRFQESHWSMK